MTGNRPLALSLPEGGQPAGPPSPQRSSRWSRPPGPRRRPETPTAPTPPTGVTICAAARARASISGRSPTPNASASIPRLSLPAPRAQAAGHGPSPRSSSGSRRSSGISPRGPCPSTAISRLCSPASAAPMAGHPSRRRRSCRSMSWPCNALPPSSLRNLRDRAILLLGFAGGLRRPEIVGGVMSPEDFVRGLGLAGILRRRRAPHFASQNRLERGRDRPRFHRAHLPGRCGRGPAEIRAHRPRARVPRGGSTGGRIRTSHDRHVARLVKRLALAAGVRGDLSARERQEKSSGHSLRAGLASSTEIDERYVEKRVGHASTKMTRG